MGSTSGCVSPNTCLTWWPLSYLDSWTLEHACCRKGYDNRSSSQALKIWDSGVLGSINVRGSHWWLFWTRGLDSIFPNREKVESDGQEEGRDDGPSDSTIFCSHASLAHPQKGKGERGGWWQWSSVLLKLMTALCSKYFVKSSLLSWNKVKFMGNITPVIWQPINMSTNFQSTLWGIGPILVENHWFRDFFPPLGSNQEKERSH